MGPLSGIRVVELAGIGPGPFCCMLLADMGAEIIRIDRMEDSNLGIAVDPKFGIMSRGRSSVKVNLKSKEGIEAVLRIIEKADALVEGFRPGVMERLGLGPDVCAARNPRLVFGRMTGWGQHGKLAPAAGHDINYISLSGALHAIGRKGEKPVPPLNLVGDFGGGAMYLAFGLVCALLEAKASGKGQVVDAAMTDGSASLMTIIYGMRAAGLWQDERGINVLDTGSPYYDVYETKDGKHVSIGSIEAKFYAELIEKMGLAGENLPKQHDRKRWPELRERFTAVFKSKTRDEWCAIMEGSDICFAPVLSLDEAPKHPHNKDRETFIEVDGVLQPGPAPRFSRTPGHVRHGARAPGEGGEEALKGWGFAASDIAALKAAGTIG